MLVVADTTPLIHLARVELLHLLPQLYREIVIPGTVWSELVEARPDAPGVAKLREAPWLLVVPDVPAPASTRALLATIDAGESAAIALALDRQASLLRSAGLRPQPIGSPPGGKPSGFRATSCRRGRASPSPAAPKRRPPSPPLTRRAALPR